MDRKIKFYYVLEVIGLMAATGFTIAAIWVTSDLRIRCLLSSCFSLIFAMSCWRIRAVYRIEALERKIEYLRYDLSNLNKKVLEEEK